MNTITHVLVNASVDRVVRGRTTAERHPIATTPFVLGGLAPDVPLIALTLGAFAWFSGVRGWPAGETFDHVFRELFYVDPGWITAHNALHAPLVLAAGLVVAAAARRPWPRPSRRLGWFLTGCAVHTALDVPVHRDDGPLLLFPLDWDLRFVGPVSYWDPAHYGTIVRPLELALVVAMAAYLLWPAVRRRLPRARGAGTATSDHPIAPGDSDTAPW